jgi:hypothetical protein
VNLETATPNAKQFIEALLAAPFFDLPGICDYDLSAACHYRVGAALPVARLLYPSTALFGPLGTLDSSLTSLYPVIRLLSLE